MSFLSSPLPRIKCDWLFPKQTLELHLHLFVSSWQVPVQQPIWRPSPSCPQCLAVRLSATSLSLSSFSFIHIPISFWQSDILLLLPHPHTPLSFILLSPVDIPPPLPPPPPLDLYLRNADVDQPRLLRQGPPGRVQTPTSLL